MRGKSARVSLILFLACALFACASQPSVEYQADAPGFLSGIWHGLSLPFSFIGSIFFDVRVYAFPNTGRWYDVGFVLGVVPSVFVSSVIFLDSVARRSL
jgi:hypothetical protein